MCLYVRMHERVHMCVCAYERMAEKIRKSKQTRVNIESGGGGERGWVGRLLGVCGSHLGHHWLGVVVAGHGGVLEVGLLLLLGG